MKKAQESAGSAAVLLSLIGLFILLYLLFVPPDFRESLLNDDFGAGTGNDTLTQVSYKLLLQEQPGLLNYINVNLCDGNECEHTLPSFSLTRSTTAKELASFNSFVIKNNIFMKQFKTLAFELPALPNTDNVLLSFNAKVHQGILTILLNGVVLFEGMVTEYNAQPISIPKKFLQPKNILEFRVSNVGAKFWHTNTYIIENLKIIGEVTDTSKEKNAQTFYISEQEYAALDYAKLKYFPDCELTQVGPLKIILNGEKIFEGVPDCGMLNILQITKQTLNKYENVIQFISTQGNYLIDQVKIRTYLKDLSYPSYYFDLTEEDLEHVQNNVSDLNVTLIFAKRPSERFDVLVHINGYTRSLNVNEDVTEVERRLPPYVLKEKNNWIMIEPEDTPINVAELRLALKPRASIS